MSASPEPRLGSWARRIDGALVAEPGDERELMEVLNVLADRHLALHRDIALSRVRLNAMEPVVLKSMTVAVGAGVALADLETALKPQGLTLGPLSPGAMALRVAEFLEGPYAGLRSIPGGRLEALCTSVSVITSDGRRFETGRAPRSAAGPDLNALVLGADGRLALVTGAVLRCWPLPEREVHLSVWCDSAQGFGTALRRFLAEGGWPWRVRATPCEGGLIAEVTCAASAGGVERDRELLEQCVEDLQGAPHPGPLPASQGEGAGSERECSWGAVTSALEQGRVIELFRLSLETVIGRGGLEGLALDVAAPWAEPGPRLLELDPRRTLGGAP